MSNEKVMEIAILGWWGAFPKAGEACSCIVVKVPGHQFLLDCGTGAMSCYLKNFTVEELDGIFLSHRHYDHVADVGSFKYKDNFLQRVGKRDSGISVYVPKETQAETECALVGISDITYINEGILWEKDGVIIKAHKVRHTIPCYSFTIEYAGKRMVYYTDTEYTEEDLDYLQDADLLLCEATVTQGSSHTCGKGHMDELQAAKLAAVAGVRELCLIHLPGDCNIEAMRQNAEQVFQKRVETPMTRSKYIL